MSRGFACILGGKIMEHGFEGDIAHQAAKHVENHRAFIEHHRTVVTRIGSQPRRLGDRGCLVVHERADGKFVDGAQAGFSAGGLFGVQLFAVACQAVGHPNVAGAGGKHGVAKPL